MTMINRHLPNASPQLAFTEKEINLLDRLVKKKPSEDGKNKNLSYYLIKVAQLGGYLYCARSQTEVFFH